MVLKAAGVECRGATGPCDVAATCDGVSDSCPANAISPTSRECRPAADACDVPDHCDGTSAQCPAYDDRHDNGYTYKCGKTCYSCRPPSSATTKRKFWKLGGSKSKSKSSKASFTKGSAYGSISRNLSLFNSLHPTTLVTLISMDQYLSDDNVPLPLRQIEWRRHLAILPLPTDANWPERQMCPITWIQAPTEG